MLCLNFFGNSQFENKIGIVYEPIVFILNSNFLYQLIDVACYNLQKQESYIYDLLSNTTKF